MVGTSGATSDPRIIFLLHDPELLEWHLKSRGYPSSTPAANRMFLYVVMRFDLHELNFLSNTDGLFSKEAWHMWSTVMDADLRIPEFRDAWPHVRPYYVKSFADYVSSRMEEMPVSLSGALQDRSEEVVKPGHSGSHPPG